MEESHKASGIAGEIPLSDIHSNNVKRGIALWQRLRSGRAFPSRADVVPRDLGDLLRNTGLVRIADGGEDFEVRLLGDAIVQAQGMSLAGYTAEMMDKVAPEYAAELRQIFRHIAKTREPLVFRGWYGRDPGPSPVYHETLFLPLGEEKVDHVLVIAAYATSRGETLR